MFTKTHDNLQIWYQEYGRHDLPWRQTSDAYKIYISEIMLQQTQVKTVLEKFYVPFLEAFPTVEALAKASLDEVLKKWEGLGYYRRARNLHEAIQKVSPRMPDSVEGLLSMKGVGQSTAHAVACFAFRIPVPILDANVKRILYRIFAKEEASEKVLWQMAYDFFDPRFAYEFNQALMDIGSAICTKTPLCHLCPLESSCLASDLNPLDYPKRKEKKTVPKRYTNILIYRDGKRIALHQRKGEFLHGLWGFIQDDRADETGEILGEVVQKYTHFHLYAKVFLIDTAADNESLVWFEPDQLYETALSKVDHQALSLFLQRCQNGV